MASASPITFPAPLDSAAAPLGQRAPAARAGRACLQPLELGAVMAQPLARHGRLPPFLRNLIGRSVIRHLDSLFILEDPFTPFRDGPPTSAQLPLPPLPPLPLIERLLAAVSSQGLGLHLAGLHGLLAETLVHLGGTPQQLALVSQWKAHGHLPALLATERGEPALLQWRSRLSEGAAPRASVDKAWVVDPAGCGFGVALVARPGAATPAALLIDPERYARLQTPVAGMGFLGGLVPLGGCHGDVLAGAELLLARGGLLALKQFGVIARVRQVRAGIAHLRWLESESRLRLVGGLAQSAVWLRDVAGDLSRPEALTSQAEEAALALKFAFNALLCELMETSAVPEAFDARDLLALTRLTGNSRQCLREVYMRARSLRAT